MHCRLIACDIDGTLLRPDRSLGDLTRKVLIKCLNRGIVVVLVTGRRPRSALRVAQDIDPRVRVIANDGAICLRQDPISIIHQLQIPRKQALPLIRSGLARKLPTYVYHATLNGPDIYHCGDFGLPQARHYAALTRAGEIRRVDDLCLLQREPSKIAMMGAETLLSEVHRQHELGSSATIMWDSYLRIHWLTVIRDGVDKSTGLARLAASLHVRPEQLVAFGDNYNDITMFRWAHTSVAVQNAVDDLKETASTVTNTNSNEGVARYIQKHVLAADD